MPVQPHSAIPARVPFARGTRTALCAAVTPVCGRFAVGILIGRTLAGHFLTVRARHVRAHRFEDDARNFPQELPSQADGDALAVNVSGSRHSPWMTRTVRIMWTVLVILLVVWVVLSVVGFAFQGLLWLAIIGIVLFVGTLVFGFFRQRAKRTAA